MRLDTIINRDALCALRELPAESVHCCVTSPPYYALRDYGMDAQIGREDTPEQYIARLVEVFRELKRVLRPDGTFWLNIADTYCGTGSKGAYTDPKNPKGRNGQSLSLARRAAGCKQKDLIGIPWLLALAAPSFSVRPCIHAPFCCLRVWDTSQQAIFNRRAGAREGENTEVGTRFLCLLFFCLLSSTLKTRKCQNLTQKRKNTAICGVPNGCIARKNGGFYSPAVSFLTSCIAFAVAVITVKSLLSMLSSNVSSCRRCVDLSVSLFGKKNWSTETSKSVTSS